MCRFVRWLLVLALSLSIGLQWAVVQGAAWVGMIVSYSQEASISESLKMTFDGAHPCEWCEAARRGESTQKKENAAKPSVKLVLLAQVHDEFFFEAPARPEMLFVTGIDGGRVESPPVPPPRTV